MGGGGGGGEGGHQYKSDGGDRRSFKGLKFVVWYPSVGC